MRFLTPAERARFDEQLARHAAAAESDFARLLRLVAARDQAGLTTPGACVRVLDRSDEHGE